MASHIEWHGEDWTREFRDGLKKNVATACIYLVNVIKADISQTGTLVYAVVPGGKMRRTIRNFTHSIPGNPPYLQTGLLRSSIAWEYASHGPGNTILGQVGTNLRYGLFLEKGTSKMAARPYIEVNMRKHAGTISAIMNRKIGPGGLPPVAPSQFRSGYLGAGARKVGYL